MNYLSIRLPDNHWLPHRPKLRANDAFIYSLEYECLRLVAPDSTKAQRRLRKRLLEDLFFTGVVELRPFMKAIMDSPAVYDFPIDLLYLSQQLTTHTLWHDFESQIFRVHSYTEATSRKLAIQSRYLQSFWSSAMLLPARQVWYRILFKKIPHSTVVHQMKVVDTPNADFAIILLKILSTLLFSALSGMTFVRFYCPLATIDFNEILSFLCTLNPPIYIGFTVYSKFTAIVSTIQYTICTNLRRYIIDNKPFLPEPIISTIKKVIDDILNSTSIG